MNKFEICPTFSTPILHSHCEVSCGVIDKLQQYRFENHTKTNMISIVNFLEFDELSNQKNIIVETLKKYLHSTCGIDKCISVEICSSWANLNRPGDYLGRRQNQNSFISGIWCIYSKEKCGELKIHSPNTNLFGECFNFIRTFPNDYNMNVVNYEIKPGDLFIFPSKLQYEVTKNESDRELVFISFNCMFRGTMLSDNTPVFL